MSASLTQAIDDLRTMRESYDSLIESSVALSPDVAQGKAALATAITGKGVTTSATDSLATMADKVTLISQGTYEIDGGEMYAKQLYGSLTTPNYWNLYEVLAQLLSDGRLVTYGGILLAEYYKGYDSLALSGAGAGGAYVVSDMENGQFKMYTSDTTHTWNTEDDGRGNRWVAYCFADEYHDFQITNTDTSPRSIFIGRKVGTITSLLAGRISQIVVPDGNELKDFGGSFEQNWGSTIILRNMLQHTTGDLLYEYNSDACRLEKLYVDIKGDIGSTIYYGRNNFPKLKDAIIKANRLAGGTIIVGGISLGFLLVEAEYISATLFQVYNYSNFNTQTVNIKTEEMPDISNLFVQALPKTISLNYIRNDRTKSIILGTFSAGGRTGTTDIILQDGWLKNLNVSRYTMPSADSIVNNIFNKLGDNTGQGTLTITLGATNLALLTEEQKAIATNKGFTLA